MIFAFASTLRSGPQRLSTNSSVRARSHDVMRRFSVLLTDYLNKRTEANNCILNYKPKIKHATGNTGDFQQAFGAPHNNSLKRTLFNNPITPHGQTRQVNSISKFALSRAIAKFRQGFQSTKTTQFKHGDRSDQL